MSGQADERVQKVCVGILDLTTVDQIKAVEEVLWARLKSIRASKGAVVRVQLKVGDTVSFTNNKGKVVFGEVTTKARTRAVVKVDGVNWRVPFDMLTKEV